MIPCRRPPKPIVRIYCAPSHYLLHQYFLNTRITQGAQNENIYLSENLILRKLRFFTPSDKPKPPYVANLKTARWVRDCLERQQRYKNLYFLRTSEICWFCLCCCLSIWRSFIGIFHHPIRGHHKDSKLLWISFFNVCCLRVLFILGIDVRLLDQIFKGYKTS